MSDRSESPHIPLNDLQLHPWHAPLLPWFLDPRAWTTYFISGIVVQGWWYIYEYAILLFCELYMRYGSHMTGVNYPTYQWMASNYTPGIISCYPGLQKKMSLNVSPHQWCSDPRMMIHVCICYPTVLWVLYAAWTMSERGELSHTPLNDLQLHPWHAQLLPWFSDRRSCTMYLISGIVVQGWWYMYGYAIPLSD